MRVTIRGRRGGGKNGPGKQRARGLPPGPERPPTGSRLEREADASRGEDDVVDLAVLRARRHAARRLADLAVPDADVLPVAERRTGEQVAGGPVEGQAVREPPRHARVQL